MPDDQYSPNTLNEALSQLIKSIATEEDALATLMRAEADKTLSFVGKDRELPTNPTNSEFIQFNLTVTKILDSILMAEWMLMKKIDTVMQFQYLVHPSQLNHTFSSEEEEPFTGSKETDWYDDEFDF